MSWTRCADVQQIQFTPFFSTTYCLWWPWALYVMCSKFDSCFTFSVAKSCAISWYIESVRQKMQKKNAKKPDCAKAFQLRVHLDDVIKWKHFPRCWPFVRVIHRSPVNSGTKASDAELWCFLWFAPEPTVEQTMETPVIWDATTLIMTSL